MVAAGILAFRRLANSVTAGIVSGVIISVIALLPLSTAAAAPKMGASLGVANNSAGDTAYKGSVDARQGQTVQIRFYYVNQATEQTDVAKNVRTKIVLPGNGDTAAVKATVSSDGADAVERQVTVKTGSDDARLQYIPGSATWRHNTGTADAPAYASTQVSDDIVGSNGVVLEDQQPSAAFGSTVSIKARVVGKGAKVTVQSQKQGETNRWSSNNSAKPGESMRVSIGYQNISGNEQKAVTMRVKLPAGAALAGNSTRVTNASQPGGTTVNSDAIDKNGVVIGSYAAGANAYVTFNVTLPPAGSLSCGNNDVKYVATVQMAEGGEYSASAVTKVNRDCSVGAATQPVKPPVAPASAGLPKSGPGETVGLFVVVTILGAVGHRVWTGRRRARNGAYETSQMWITRWHKSKFCDTIRLV